MNATVSRKIPFKSHQSLLTRELRYGGFRSGVNKLTVIGPDGTIRTVSGGEFDSLVELPCGVGKHKLKIDYELRSP